MTNWPSRGGCGTHAASGGPVGLPRESIVRRPCGAPRPPTWPRPGGAAREPVDAWRTDAAPRSEGSALSVLPGRLSLRGCRTWVWGPPLDRTAGALAPGSSTGPPELTAPCLGLKPAGAYLRGTRAPGGPPGRSSCRGTTQAFSLGPLRRRARDAPGPGLGATTSC
ncbi:hypothetical protein NDU88_002836 [Pleurodeles waltl]|uniref:Uncharacterized protein n=1 Tax=Pleurodeles waltl TaxID=8319 RepID=A0AAV7RD82_PLEWA|nr:hypothetical protein NDU88_002836 [Pleurodeles waltl]